MSDCFYLISKIPLFSKIVNQKNQEKKMKKSIITFTAVALLMIPTIALAKGGHGGGHGGHGGHHSGSHTSHTSKSGGSKTGGSKGSTTVKSGSSGSKSSSHTSTHSVLHGGGTSAFARNAFRASSNATPVSSWKSLNTETKSFTDTTNNIPQLYQGNSATNFLLYQSLFHPRHHYVPKEDKPKDLEKEEEVKSYLKIGLIVGGVAILILIASFICYLLL